MTEEFPLAPEADIRAAVTDLIDDRIPADIELKHTMRGLYATPEDQQLHKYSFGSALVRLANGEELNIDCIGRQMHGIPVSASQFTKLAAHLFNALDDRGADRLSAAIKLHAGTLHGALVEKKYG